MRDARWVGRVVLLAALGGTSFAEQGTAGTSGPDPCQLRDGDTVVVKTADDRTLRGAVNRLSTEALVLGGTGGVETVPRDRIQSLRVRTGRRSQAAKGAKIGALVWLGYTVLVLAGGVDESGVVSWQALAGLGFTTAAGAGIGAMVKAEEWKECCTATLTGARVLPEPGS